MRTTAVLIRAPPRRAPSAPSTARATSAATATTRIRGDDGLARAASSGSRRPDGERRRRRPRRLQRAGGGDVGDPQLVADVGAEGVVVGQLAGDLGGQRWVESAPFVDPRQLVELADRVGGELAALLGEVGPLGVALRAHRHVLADGHRHRPGDQSGGTGGEDRVARTCPPRRRRRSGWPSTRCRRWRRALRPAASRCAACGGAPDAAAGPSAPCPGGRRTWPWRRTYSASVTPPADVVGAAAIAAGHVAHAGDVGIGQDGADEVELARACLPVRAGDGGDGAVVLDDRGSGPG